MGSMFDTCNTLTSLDLNNFSTSNVTNMRKMFDSCTALTSLDLSSFNTSEVTDMNSMFNACKAVDSLGIRSFNTSKVTDMGWMFGSCEALTSLDISSFNTSKVTNMSWMFSACHVLTSLDLSNFDISNISHTAGWTDGLYMMFYNTCSNNAGSPITGYAKDAATAAAFNNATDSATLGNTKIDSTKLTFSVKPAPTTSPVSLIGNGGAGTDLTSYTEGTGATLPTDWTKEGYTFAGWYDNEAFSGSPVTSITSSDSGAKKYYAKWTLDKPAAMKAVKAKAAGKHAAKLTWSKADGADLYRVYRAASKSGSAKSASAAGTYKYIGKTTGTSFTAKGLKAGTRYYFVVKAVNDAGTVKSTAVSVKTAKEPVSFRLANSSGSNVKVKWSKVSGASRYQVASDSSGKMKTRWTGANSLCTYTSTGLTKGKTYKFRMRYRKTVGGKKVWSSWTSVKTIKVK
jgi:uncharacterized repeat protein (TIGR02543 family)